MRKGIIIAVLLILLPFIHYGQEREWLLNKDSLFTSIASEHFTLYSEKGHLSAETRHEILKERELAYREISYFFKMKVDLSMNIFLFESEQLKYKITGHKGLGWGFDNTIVEVFNDSIRLDPYHELVHVLGYAINQPPALIDEGTAVYLSQLYGDKAFSRLTGYPAKSINEILLMLNEKKELVKLPALLLYDEIGQKRNSFLEYCQSASFVEYLITQFGEEKFLKLYRSLSNSNHGGNEMMFELIYKKDIRELEIDWKTQVGLDKE